jgi:hypothetical protein
MAAGSLPAPGTKHGPCMEACQHRDCQLTREDAAEICIICGEPIGYNRRFYQEEQGKVHSLCLYNQKFEKEVLL